MSTILPGPCISCENSIRWFGSENDRNQTRELETNIFSTHMQSFSGLRCPFDERDGVRHRPCAGGSYEPPELPEGLFVGLRAAACLCSTRCTDEARPCVLHSRAPGALPSCTEWAPAACNCKDGSSSTVLHRTEPARGQCCLLALLYIYCTSPELRVPGR